MSWRKWDKETRRHKAPAMGMAQPASWKIKWGEKRSNFKQKTMKPNKEKNSIESFILLYVNKQVLGVFPQGPLAPSSPPHFPMMLINCFIPFPTFLLVHEPSLLFLNT